eukprot:3940326-Rhodomonas_salina.1
MEGSGSRVQQCTESLYSSIPTVGRNSYPTRSTSKQRFLPSIPGYPGTRGIVPDLRLLSQHCTVSNCMLHVPPGASFDRRHVKLSAWLPMSDPSQNTPVFFG